MDWVPSLIGAITLMLLFFFAGLPVFVTFLIVNALGMAWLMGTSGFGMFANSIYQTVTSGSLAAVPLFILMGEILFRSGSIDVLVESVNKLFGQYRGKDYAVITVLSVIFGALCGSTVAVAALLGRTIMPSMQARGYDARLTSGAIAGGATLAAIIPPSLVVIILGSQVDVSIASLLVAGILPGIVLALLIFGYTYLRIVMNPRLEPPVAASHASVHSLAERIQAIFRISPFFLVIFFVMGLILLGIATPSESAATGVIGALMTAVIYKKLSRKMFTEALLSSAKVTTMILI
ncbi:MAG: TRAP transporter large permease subunit, partial [bacterium]